ncbi:hypothetical protein CA13_30040 [Planctomycetes bacterium CA13]|uniref:Uncharacterized protein n=1 Tax=Novipirellula herctigrandis TaxID=2527986 RepID=A0A5C5Z3Z4_9BACT|nr:hypothetical protein CA13_30040 [Planctomycetes bacterium CA13]
MFCFIEVKFGEKLSELFYAHPGAFEYLTPIGHLRNTCVVFRKYSNTPPYSVAIMHHKFSANHSVFMAI